MLLDTGCLCCTMRGDLVETLTDLHRKRASGAIPPFGHLLIETTGLADPVPVLQTVVADEALGQVYRLHDVVTLVDAVHGEAQLDAHPESVKQAAVADALLVTKTDLAAPATRGRAAAPARAPQSRRRGARSRARRDRPGGRSCAATSTIRARKAPDVERWLKADGLRGAARTTAHAHDVNRHDERIRAFCLYHDRPIRRAGLVMWLDMLAGLRGANLLRVKGVLNVEGDPVVVHAVQTVVHEPVVLDALADATIAARGSSSSRATWRARRSSARSTRSITPPRRQRTGAIDPAAYAQFVEAMRGFR